MLCLNGMHRDPRSSSWEQRADANNQPAVKCMKLHEISTTVPLKPFKSTHHTSICSKLHDNKVSRVFIKRWKIKKTFLQKPEIWNCAVTSLEEGSFQITPAPTNGCINRWVHIESNSSVQWIKWVCLFPLSSTVTLISFLPLSYHILQRDWPQSQACGPKLSQRRINALKMNSKQHQTPPFSPVAQPEQSCQPKLLHVDFIRDPSSSSRHALNPLLSWFSPHKICRCFSQLQTETSLMTSFQCDSPGSTHPDRGGRQSQNQSQ